MSYLYVRLHHSLDWLEAEVSRGVCYIWICRAAAFLLRLTFLFAGGCLLLAYTIETRRHKTLEIFLSNLLYSTQLI